MSNAIHTILDEQENEKYPMLPNFDYGRRWLDGFISIIEAYLLSMSSILLTVAGGMSMFAFLTGGLSFQAGSPALNLWALIQTVAVDMQFSIMWYKFAQYWRQGKYLQAIGYAVLGLILSIVLFEAYAVPAMESTMRRSFDETMNGLGFDPKMMVFIRSGVAIMLMIVGACNRTIFVFSRDGKAQHIGVNPHNQLSQIAQSQTVKSQGQLPAILPAKTARKEGFFSRRSRKKNAKNSAPAQEESGQVETEKIVESAAADYGNVANSQLRILQVEQEQPAEVVISNSLTSFREVEQVTHVSEQDIQEFLTRAGNEEIASSSDPVLEGSGSDEPQTNPPVLPVHTGSGWELEPSQEPQENQTGTAPELTGTYGRASLYNSAPAAAGGASAHVSHEEEQELNTSGRLAAIRGMMLDELLEYEPLKATFRRKDTRLNAVLAAIKSGDLIQRKDNSVTRNAINTWLRERAKVES